MAIYSGFSRFTDFPDYDIPCESSARVNFVPVMTVVPPMRCNHHDLQEIQAGMMKRDKIAGRSYKTVSKGHPWTGSLPGESEGIARQGWFVEEID
jgi:hypothetical protein